MRERTLQTNIRMTPPEHEAIMRKAQKAKMPLSRYIILSALNKTVVSTEELKQVHFLLKNISGNVNQLTVLSHQGKVNMAYFDRFCNELNSVKQEFSKFNEGR